MTLRRLDYVDKSLDKSIIGKKIKEFLIDELTSDFMIISEDGRKIWFVAHDYIASIIWEKEVIGSTIIDFNELTLDAGEKRVIGRNVKMSDENMHLTVHFYEIVTNNGSVTIVLHFESNGSGGGWLEVVDVTYDDFPMDNLVPLISFDNNGPQPKDK